MLQTHRKRHELLCSKCPPPYTSYDILPWKKSNYEWPPTDNLKNYSLFVCDKHTKHVFFHVGVRHRHLERSNLIYKKLRKSSELCPMYGASIIFQKRSISCPTHLLLFLGIFARRDWSTWAPVSCHSIRSLNCKCF